MNILDKIRNKSEEIIEIQKSITLNKVDNGSTQIIFSINNFGNLDIYFTLNNVSSISNISLNKDKVKELYEVLGKILKEY